MPVKLGGEDLAAAIRRRASWASSESFEDGRRDEDPAEARFKKEDVG
jgi:hypothetical protein